MIDIELVKQAKIIRNKHIDTIDKYNHLLTVLDGYKTEILLYQEKLTTIDTTVENYENTSKVLELMDEFDKTINELSKQVKPLIDEMDELKDKANKVYLKIKENHPNKTDEELQTQLFKQLEEL
jgi:hypothetical protein